MKKLFTLLSLILAMFVFVSCASDDEDSTDDSAAGKTCESSSDCPINYTCDPDKKVCEKTPTDNGDTTPSDQTDTADTTPSDPTDTTDTTPADPTDTDNGDTGSNDPADSGDTGNNQPAPAACEINQSFKMSAYKDGEHYLFYGSGIVSASNATPTATKEGTYTSLYTESIPNTDKTTSFLTAGTVQGYNAHIVNTLVYDNETSKPAYQVEVIIWDDDYLEGTEEGAIIDHTPDVRITSIKNYFGSDGETLEATKFCIVAYSSLADDEDELAIGKFQYCKGENGTMNVGETVKFGVDAKLTSDMDEIQGIFGVTSPEALCWCQASVSGATCD